MPKKIPGKTRKRIIRLYDKGSGLSPPEIARRIGVSYSCVYGLTRIRQRINPETGEPFASRREYREYSAKRKINPETGGLYPSRSEYKKHSAMQRRKRPENQALSKLIKKRLNELRKDQSWLAGEMGVTRQAVSLYVRGKSVPKKDLLQKLYSSLDVPYKTLDDLLEDLNNE